MAFVETHAVVDMSSPSASETGVDMDTSDQRDSPRLAQVFWKVFPTTLPRKFKWRTGLNALEGVEFDDDPEDRWSQNRLYYKSQEDTMDSRCGVGDYIVRVFEPVDDPLFRMIDLGNMRGANRVVLDATHWSMFDMATYDMLATTSGIFPKRLLKQAIVRCSESGTTTFLQQWLESPLCKGKHESLYNEGAMDGASGYGNIDALQWWKDSGLQLKYSNDAMDQATKCGHTAVLQWWKDSGLELKYDMGGQTSWICRTWNIIEMMDWWHKSGLPFTYTSDDMDGASACKALNILDWWLQTGRPLKYTSKSMDYASACGELEVLNWWLKSGLKLEYTEQSIEHASAAGQVDVLDWWRKSGLPLKYTSKAMDRASTEDCVASLEWWRQSGLELKYTTESMDDPSWGERQKTLDWWVQSGLELRYTEKALIDAIAHHRIPVLMWWLRSNLELKHSKRACDLASSSTDPRLARWWRANCHKFLLPTRAA